jgi:hypothetical protein
LRFLAFARDDGDDDFTGLRRADVERLGLARNARATDCLSLGNDFMNIDEVFSMGRPRFLVRCKQQEN